MVEWLNNIFSCLLVLLNPSMRFSVSIVAVGLHATRTDHRLGETSKDARVMRSPVLFSLA
jgi:hypothetical protein